MDADMSLSASLGGLRVTNPDAASPAPVADAVARPPPSTRSSADTITDQRSGALLPQLSHQRAAAEESGLGFNPATYSYSGDTPPAATPPAGARPRPNLPMGQSAPPSLGPPPQQSIPYAAYASNGAGAGGTSRQLRQPSVPSAMRPVSGLYMQPNTSSSSNTSNPGLYRYRDDMGSSDGSVSSLARAGSRSVRGGGGGGAGVMHSAAITRDGSRAYRQPSQQLNGGSGPLPPRRNSKRSQAPTGGSGTGYDAAAPDAVAYRGGGGDGGSGSGATSMPPRTAEEWQERGAAVGRTQDRDAAGQAQSRVVKKGVKDFNFGRSLGEGSYSTVLAATDRQTLKEYAVKVLDKRHIIKEKKVKYVNIERDTLNRLTEHPGIVRLYYTFQDERSLYFVLDLASGGELLGVLKKLGSFDVECTRFYGAEILDSVAYMHSRGIIHRDLKPENVLLDRDMHVKITDFGTAKILPDPKRGDSGHEAVPGNPTDGAESDRAVSFVGTAEYVSPELLRDKNACKASDLWAFGCIIYQLLAGRPPFKAANEYLTFQKILGLDYSFPDGFPELARDLVERLLVLEPSSRLPIEHIKNHKFFEGVQWGRGLWRQKAPRLKPYVPPPADPIKLNGANKNTAGGLAAASAAAAYSSPMPNASSSVAPQPVSNGRPQLRGVTELAPPSQLDIDWSPVLKRDNERILKLGNLIVGTGAQAQSPSGDPSTSSEKPKFSRFFGGNAARKRERLVLITTGARLFIAAAGGNEKKAKVEIDLLASGTSWKSYVDPKGLTAWTLNTRDKQFTFEDPRGTPADAAGTKYSTQEWLDAVEQARELSIAQSATGSYSGESMLQNMGSSMSSATDSIGGGAPMALPGQNMDRHMLRQTLRKNTDDESPYKGRKRFSKRHSKSGLAAVF